MLVLGSGSPRRADLLRQIGLEFRVQVADIDETPGQGESPAAYVRRMAEEKLQALLPHGDAVLCADTTVVIGEQTLGKPANAAESAAMLRRLSGRSHRVMTAVAVGRADRILGQCLATTDVHFRTLLPEEIDAYVALGEGLDKAGSYGIQGVGGGFVKRIDGSYANVVGLPIAEVIDLLRAVGELPQWPIR